MAGTVFAQTDEKPVVTAGDGSADITTPGSESERTATGDDANAVIQTYAPAYFDEFQPNTARDMVARIPGFTLRGGNDGERGFGEADTNFLINGRRPSTKSQSANDLLERIPASSVIRIEILDGASLDIPGLTGQVVNVSARAVELSGNWRYAARFEEGTAPQLLEGDFNLSGKRGDLAFALGLSSGQFTRTEDSVEQFFTDDPANGGVLFEDRREQPFINWRNPSATLNLSWTPDTGTVANLNGRLQRPNRNSGVFEQFTAVGPGGTTGESIGVNGEDEWEYEISGDYARPVGIGTLKGIGLYRDESSDITTVLVRGNAGEIPIRTEFGRDEDELEVIGRVEYAWGWRDVHDLQLSGEYAFNRLDSATLFTNNFVPPVTDSVRVEEDRFDVRLSDSWTLSDTVTLQGSIGAEYSELGVVAPGEDARDFFRPKGFVAGSWKQSPLTTWRARVERGVGQLNFGDFVSTRSLVDNIINAGNDDIRPDQFWNVSVEWERNDPSLFSLRVSPFYRYIEDPVDRVLFADGTEGPGNLDSAERYGIEGDATLVMDSLGVPGLQFDAEFLVQDSAIDDPLTGESRTLNGQVDWNYELEARYDIPGTSIAPTAEVEHFLGTPFVRFNEIQQTREPEPEVELGIIFKDVFGLQVEIAGQNLLDAPIIRERTRFNGPDQRLGPVTSYERFDRFRGRRLSIQITDTF